MKGDASRWNLTLKSTSRSQWLGRRTCTSLSLRSRAESRPAVSVDAATAAATRTTLGALRMTGRLMLVSGCGRLYDTRQKARGRHRARRRGRCPAMLAAVRAHLWTVWPRVGRALRGPLDVVSEPWRGVVDARERGPIPLYGRFAAVDGADT